MAKVREKSSGREIQGQGCLGNGVKPEDKLKPGKEGYDGTEGERDVASLATSVKP